MNRLFMVFIMSIFSICLFLSCDIVDLDEYIVIQNSNIWYSFKDNGFKPMPKDPAVLSIEIKNEIIEVYFNKISTKFNAPGWWSLTIDDVWVENYYGIYNDGVAVLLYHKRNIPGNGPYNPKELEIVIDGVSFLYGPIIGSNIVIFKNGKLYDLQEAYGKGFLVKKDLKNIAYYHNKDIILPQRTDRSPLEDKIILNINIDDDFDDRTIIIITDKNYTSWRILASDFSGINVIRVESLMVNRLFMNPNLNSVVGDIILIEIGNPGKQNVINTIRKLEKLDFIKCAEPNYIMYPAND